MVFVEIRSETRRGCEGADVPCEHMLCVCVCVRVRPVNSGVGGSAVTI